MVLLALFALACDTTVTIHSSGGQGLAGSMPLGSPCVLSDDCASGFCVDGVCCSDACEGQC